MAKNRRKAGLSSQKQRSKERTLGLVTKATLPTKVSCELRTWLDTSFSSMVAPTPRIDLRKYLQETALFELAVQERLRLLAVYLEEGSQEPFDSLYPLLHPIYLQASAYAPDDGESHRSWTVCWLNLMPLEEDCPARQKTLSVLRQRLGQALALKPGNSRLLEAQGLLLYYLGDTKEAVDHLERCLSIDSSNNSARWHHAFCLHEQARYSQALITYRRVDPSQLPNEWHRSELQERVAHCLLMSGRKSEALNKLETILSRYESEPHLAEEAMSDSFWQTIETVPAKHLKQRAERLWEQALEGL